MGIAVNEFSTLAEAIRAHSVFPKCGTCKHGAKVQHIRDRFLVLCIERPEAHHGIRREGE